MGYSVTIGCEPGSDSWAVALKINLTRAESNALFLSGDSMLSWPLEGLQVSGDSRLERSSMFVSEVAARTTGLTISYSLQAGAERAATLLRTRLAAIGIAEEK